jgi:hypothetical protein
MRLNSTWEERGYRIAATGTWLYDRTVRMKVLVWAKPASFAYARFDDDENLIEGRPTPETKDGFLYFFQFQLGASDEYLTIEEAKAAAEAKPWGPIRWD